MLLNAYLLNLLHVELNANGLLIGLSLVAGVVEVEQERLHFGKIFLSLVEPELHAA